MHSCNMVGSNVRDLPTQDFSSGIRVNDIPKITSKIKDKGNLPRRKVAIELLDGSSFNVKDNFSRRRLSDGGAVKSVWKIRSNPASLSMLYSMITQ